MTRADRSDGPGRGFVLAGAGLGLVVSLAVGLLVAAVLNSLLADYWIRGIATLAVGLLVAGLMLRTVFQTARSRLRAVGLHGGGGHARERP